jgi:hypothetical protein
MTANAIHLIESLPTPVQQDICDRLAKLTAEMKALRQEACQSFLAAVEEAQRQGEALLKIAEDAKLAPGIIDQLERFTEAAGGVRGNITAIIDRKLT